VHDKVSMCIGCHGIPGYKTAYPVVYHVPKIGGQTAAYLENALKSQTKVEGDKWTLTGHHKGATSPGFQTTTRAG
jgi:hypothetical protein